MTESEIVYTDLADSGEAGRFLGTTISDAFHDQPPDALIVFASPRYNFTDLLQAIDGTCRPKVMVGCSSAGEFISGVQGEGAACVVGLRSADMQFTAGVAHELNTDRAMAARSMVDSFAGMSTHRFPYRSALVLTDALAGYMEDLVDQLDLLTAGTYRFFGGGAGDDAKFHQTHVFYGTTVLSNAAVALEMLSTKPLGVGVRHGWTPAGPALRVTEVDGMRLISLNAIPAVEAFQEHAERTGQSFDPTNPLPFFLHNVLGIDTGNGYRLRVPLTVNPDGSVSCAAEVPYGALVRIMEATSRSATDAANEAVQSALQQIGSHRPKVALFFDCVATRLRLGKEFGLELQALQQAIAPAQYVGCNTYGQIARAEDLFSGFHNCTATVCIIPE